MDKTLIKEVIADMLRSGELCFDISGEGNVEYDYGNSSSYVNLTLSINIDGELIQSCSESITLA